MRQKRIRDYGVALDTLPTGPLNKITDVPGVLVGHCTIDTPQHKTGVTMLLPRPENPFTHQYPAASFVLNGFGKSIGLLQIDELGTLETPIALTNTLNVGLVHDALVEYMVQRCQSEGVPLTSVNPVVCECNDSTLSDICQRAVQKEHVFSAIASASRDFEEGAVGGGCGMVCHGLKGGIGSASRIIELPEGRFTLGVLVQANHGRLPDLLLEGKPIGTRIDSENFEPDKGSIIVLLATDLPASDRQLKRILKRTSVGLARLGSFIGHGSGEVMIGFSTSNTIHRDAQEGILTQRVLNEEKIDLAFQAAAYACQEAVLNALATSKTTVGYQGDIRKSLAEFLPGLGWRANQPDQQEIL